MNLLQDTRKKFAEQQRITDKNSIMTKVIRLENSRQLTFMQFIEILWNKYESALSLIVLQFH